MAVPQTQKRVGPAGCLISLALFVLSIVGFFGMIVWAGVGVANDLKASPSVPVGTESTVTLNTTGTYFLFLGNLDSPNTRLPLANPSVTVTDPNGNNVRVTRSSTTSSGSSSSGDFRSIGEFTATTTGSYTIDSTDSISSSASGAKIYVTTIDFSSVFSRIGMAFVVGGVLFLASVILAIVWLVRRSKNTKSGAPPAYQPPGAPYQQGPAPTAPYQPPAAGAPPSYQPPAAGAPPSYQPPAAPYQPPAAPGAPPYQPPAPGGPPPPGGPPAV